MNPKIGRKERPLETLQRWEHNPPAYPEAARKGVEARAAKKAKSKERQDDKWNSLSEKTGAAENDVMAPQEELPVKDAAVLELALKQPLDTVNAILAIPSPLPLNEDDEVAKWLHKCVRLQNAATGNDDPEEGPVWQAIDEHGETLTPKVAEGLARTVAVRCVKALHAMRAPGNGVSLLAALYKALSTPIQPFVPTGRASLPRLANLTKEDGQIPLFSIPACEPQALQLSLPGFAPTAPGVEICPSWLLRLFDAGGGESMAQGRGAPWPLRLFIGALLHVGIPERDGYWHSFVLPTEDVISWLHPKGWANRKRDWEKFPEALQRINRGLGSVDINGTDVLLVVASGIPRRPDAPFVEFSVRVPARAARGDRLDWPTLCRYGTESAVLYRAYLAVSAFLGRSARAGHPITAKIEAPLLGADGKPIREKGGQIKRVSGALVENPAAIYSRSLSDVGLTGMLGFDPSNKVYRLRARQAFERLAEDKVIDLQKDGKLWRVFGPAKRIGLQQDTPPTHAVTEASHAVTEASHAVTEASHAVTEASHAVTVFSLSPVKTTS